LSNFEDDHESLERELVSFFETTLGPRVFGPAREEMLKLVREHLADAAEADAQARQQLEARVEQLHRALDRIEQAREEQAQAAQEQYRLLAEEARRRIDDIGRAKVARLPDNVEERLGRIEQYLGHLAATSAPARGSRTRETIPPPPVYRPGLAGLLGSPKVTLGLAAALVVSLILIVVLGLQVWWKPSAKAAPVVELPPAAAPDTPSDEGWAAIRTAGWCQGLPADCSFDEAWAARETPQRRAIAVRAVQRAATAGQCPAFSQDARRAWTAETARSLEQIGRCLGDPLSPPAPDVWPSDEELKRIARWALDQGAPA